LLRLGTRFPGKSDTFFQKIDQTAEKTDRRLTFQIHVMKRSSVAGCPGEQTGRGCERWSGGKLRQAAQRCRAAKANLTAKHAGCHFAHTRQLACAACQHHAVASGASQPGRIKAILDVFKRLLDSRADDVDHHTTRYFRELVLFFAHQRNRQQFTIIVRARFDIAIQGLQALGMDQGR